MQVNIHEAKTHLSKLIKQALEGEDVIIAKDNKPVIQLKPVDDIKPTRKLGSAKGLIHMEEDFDAPVGDFEDYIS